MVDICFLEIDDPEPVLEIQPEPVKEQSPKLEVETEIVQPIQRPSNRLYDELDRLMSQNRPILVCNSYEGRLRVKPLHGNDIHGIKLSQRMFVQCAKSNRKLGTVYVADDIMPCGSHYRVFGVLRPLCDISDLAEYMRGKKHAGN